MFSVSLTTFSKDSTSYLSVVVGFNLYLSIKYFAIGPPIIPPNISPKVAAAIATVVDPLTPIASAVFPKAAAPACPPSIETEPAIIPNIG